MSKSRKSKAACYTPEDKWYVQQVYLVHRQTYYPVDRMMWEEASSEMVNSTAKPVKFRA